MEFKERMPALVDGVTPSVIFLRFAVLSGTFVHALVFFHGKVVSHMEGVPFGVAHGTSPSESSN